MIVTYNPKTARKQACALENKLERLRQELLLMRAKVRANTARWRDPESVQDRYQRFCQQLHISPQFYQVSLERSKSGLKMRFRRDLDQVRRKEVMLGKNIIITDDIDWSSREIVEASLDRVDKEGVLQSEYL